MEKPLLLIDIDGVISLFGFDPNHPPEVRFEMVDGIAHFLSAAAGEHLRELSLTYELAWCSGWEEKANEYLPLALGLPGALPHLSFSHELERLNNHWKLDAIEAYAGSSRALAWVDDAHDDECQTWAAHRRGPTLLVATDPAIGLTRTHVLQLRNWAHDLGADGFEASTR